ncbi:chalcone isomerase family protein [Vibrio palustris]|uniref:Chalcone isomerase domain-containing protein n=1 Tax=Vibrio palustris TaxID=1918946 RepID=A0A1R4B314_9VIBR|nr:chalcone isomerase family protein [Vibrio palustris]SJL83308.1 hypothetical protein VPAL9027_01274 [Vibrio palustris]
MIKRGLILTIIAMLFSHAALAQGSQWQQWPRVGQAHFTWLWFDVYDSTLHAPNGKYVNLASPLALHITYRRTISAEDLLTATDKQWKKLNYKKDDIAQWMNTLKKVFPSVKDGDQLVYQSNGKTGTFYFKPTTQSEFKTIGEITDSTFNRAFLSIWLSENSQYPDLRNQLIGGT